ncbi:fibronectin type III domain-containing protein [Flavobacterium sp. XGLA_31]|uniref:fibronectin type III domain-containing protein n=1 Tax=Flavobacterium sp. XGLA_31 TaxID=3447666 RepID=UPI003F30F88A
MKKKYSKAIYYQSPVLSKINLRTAILFLVLLFGTNNTSAQCNAYTQVFESFNATATAGWLNSVQSYTTSTANSYTGRYAALLTTTAHYVTTPLVTKSGTMTFYYKSLVSGSAFSVDYSSTQNAAYPGAAWTNITTISSAATVPWTQSATLTIPANVYVRFTLTTAKAVYFDDIAITSTDGTTAATDNVIITPKTGVTTTCTQVIPNGIDYYFYDNGGPSDVHSPSQNNNVKFVPADPINYQIQLEFISFNSINSSSVSTGAISLTDSDTPLSSYSGATNPTTTIYNTTNGIDRSITVNFTTTSNTNPATGFLIKVRCIPATLICSTVSNLTINSFTYQSVTLGWTPPASAPGNGYDYYITTNASPTLPDTSTAIPAPSGTTLVTGNEPSGTATGTTVNGLAGDGTTYYVWVRSNCGSSYSAWQSVGSFTTLCNPVNVTYTENFNGLNGPLPTCTSAVNGSNTTSSAWVTSLATGMVYCNQAANMFITKPINLVAGTTYRLTYDYGSNNGTSDFKVYYGTTNGTANYSNINSLLYTHSGIAAIQSNLIDFTPGSTGVYYIGFSLEALQSPSTTVFNLDNVVVQIENCFIPTLSATVTAIGASSATINWTAPTPAPASGYQYYISTTNAAPNYNSTASGTIAAGATSYTFTGLTSGFTYYVWLRSNCGGSEYSNWSSSATFTTLNSYCASTAVTSTNYINDFVTTGGTTNITNTNSGFSAGGYGNFISPQTVSQTQNGTVSFTASINNISGGFGVSVFVDWNQNGVFTDAGERVYSTNGSYIFTNPSASFTVPVTALSGTTRMRIVANYSSSTPVSCNTGITGETEDYTFVVTTLPCAGYPTNITSIITSTTTTTVSWTAASPAPTNGYQYFLSTSNSNPLAAATPTGSTASGITTVNLTGLTPSTNYYIWVRSNCNAILGQGVWIGPINFYQPNCTVGGGTGTTSLGCPDVIAGGLGLSGADPAPITCTSSSCVNLEATYLQLGQTTNYTVQSIPYAPPYQFSCLANSVSVSSDDVWSPTISLPFNFCFYGNSYNSCIIGSNGLLSFNTANAGGASGYSFSNNLPSTTGALFANTIYGVYHDIDPSEGGVVGWELITLNTGCRALVASWSDVPMFSDNSILYTGMMVLYENTNVIEVYIKEKNIDNNNVSPWNGGNAIVGVQNGSGTQAVVAPGRNGLDTNWTATNEAWRFVPSGTSITTIKWYQGAGTTGPVVGTSATVNVCPTATTVYTAEVTYTLCNGTTLKKTDQTTVTVTGSKVWNGSVDTDWNKANNWTPTGVPTNLDCVVIPDVTNDPIISGTSYNAYGYNLSVLSGGNLTLNSGNNLTITDFVKVITGGTFTVKNSANLIQINNVTNSGSITMERTTSVRQPDYVYWSSPVANFNVDNITAPIASGAIYKWNTTIANNNGGQGTWESAAGNTMLPAKGYIVGGPGSFSATVPATLLGSFTGVPNNGIITTTIYRGSDQNTAYHTGYNGTEINNYSDNWNLLGNPYPSSIRGSQFLYDNNTKIMGQIRLWTHGTLPSLIASPFYDTFVYNYNPGDYFTYNFTGTSCCPAASADLFVGAGQGFFVQMIDGPTGSTTVSFNNALRNESYSNTTFYKSSNQAPVNNSFDVNNLERNRIWLDLLNANNESDRILVGYIEGATMGTDSFFDAGTLAVTPMALYSLIGDDKFVIQGRSTPFNPNDIVPLGLKTATAGNYTIAIGGVDGLFENPNRNIYIEDTEMGITQSLREAPYTFFSPAGTNNTRFKLRYKYQRGNGNNSKSAATEVVVVSSNKQITVQSFDENIQQIQVYDMLGRELYSATGINANEYLINTLNESRQTLVIKITLNNGKTVTKKLLH